MTYEQKRQIEALRLNNMSYGKIAKETGVSKDSVKSYCRRHGLKKEDLILYEKCLQCGTPLVQTAGRKLKKFCSDACRMEWWNSHQEASVCKEKNRKICEFCGEEYYSSKPSSRFCSCKCYADYRRSGGKKNAGKEGEGLQDYDQQTVEAAEADVERTDLQREKLPPMQSHPLCDECPWFILGQRILEINDTLTKAVQPNNIKPTNKEE